MSADKQFIEKRIKDISDIYCADYPDIDNSDSLTRLWAVESTLAGTNNANEDLHKLIKILRIRCGLTAIQAADLYQSTFGE